MAATITKAFMLSSTSGVGGYVKCVPCMLQQLRYKGPGRFTAPPVPKDKKWVIKSKRSTAKAKVYPKNWEEKFLARVPQDDVWMRAAYPRPAYTFQEALTMHKEFASPDMLDNKNGPVNLHLTLDMRTKKQTKFMGNIKKTVVLPHNFEDGTENKVLVFCKSPEEIEKAQELGAMYAGSYELIKSIEKGDIKMSEIDHVVCMLDVLTDLAVIRKQLKLKFPSYSNGNLGNNLEELVTHFVQGKSYESKKISENTAELKLQLGKISMPSEEIIANYNTYIDAVCSHRSSDLGYFVKEAFVTCPPSTEKFLLTQQTSNKTPTKKTKKVPRVEESKDEGEAEDDEEEQKVAAHS